MMKPENFFENFEKSPDGWSPDGGVVKIFDNMGILVDPLGHAC